MKPSDCLIDFVDQSINFIVPKVSGKYKMDNEIKKNLECLELQSRTKLQKYYIKTTAKICT